MKTIALWAICLGMISFNAFAQTAEKGILFKIGEIIMGLGGYSYVELEKKTLDLDKGLTACLGEVGQMKLQNDEKDKELKACQADGPPTPMAIDEAPVTETPTHP